VSDTGEKDERAYKIQVEIFHVLSQDYSMNFCRIFVEQKSS
jgi:hypothetical protein